MSEMIGPYEQTAEAKAAYDARWQRLLSLARLEQPDRMPVGLHSFFWPANYGGITYKELMYDYDKAKQVTLDAAIELEPDGVYPLLLGSTIGRMLEKFDFKQLQWPGHGVGDMQPFQYLDREYMKAEEYDDFLFDPTGFYLHKYLPRVLGVFEGFDKLPRFAGMHYLRTMYGMRPFALPEVRASFDRIVAAAEETNTLFAHHLDWVQRLRAAGFPLANGTVATSPYDIIADYFRGATGMMKDLYRHKDKLKLVLDKMSTIVTRITIERQTGRPPDRLHPHPLGAGRLHEPEAVRGVLVAAVPQDADGHDRGRPDPDADVGIRLHQAPGGHQGHSGRQVHLLVRAHRPGEGLRGARRPRRPARQPLAFAADHRHAGGGRCRRQAPRGQHLEQGRLHDARRRLRHSGRDPGRQRARHVQCGAEVRRLMQTRREIALAGARQKRLRDAEILRRVAAAPVRGGAAALRARLREEALELVRTEHLLEAAYSCRIVPLEAPPAPFLRAGGERLHAPRLLPESGTLTALGCAVCTAGPKIEARVRALFAGKRPRWRWRSTSWATRCCSRFRGGPRTACWPTPCARD